MSIKTQIQFITGLNEEYLTEGIRFFRNSKRIEKLIKKFEVALITVRDPETKNEVEDYIRQLKKAKLDFEAVEQKFMVGDKTEAKEEYNQLKIKFASIIADINKESVKHFMITAGLAAFVFALFSSIVPHSIQTPIQQPVQTGMPTRDSLTMDEKTIQNEINTNNNLLKITKDKLKALNIFDKNQHLIAKLAAEQAKISSQLGK